MMMQFSTFMPEQAHILQMTLVFSVILGAIILYLQAKIAIAFTSMVILIALMLLFTFLPVPGLGINHILSGFANPALLTILSLLVLGDGLEKTGIFERFAERLCDASHGRFFIIFGFALLFVTLSSAFLNNTPLVVIMIPVMRTIALRAKHAPSAFMMPLSYAAILGGMTTLIGSSTNLLVSGELVKFGHAPLSFFEFTPIGGLVALAGFLYILLILPSLLPNLSPKAVTSSTSKRKFVAQFYVNQQSFLLNVKIYNFGRTDLKGISIKSVSRQGKIFKEPFTQDKEGFTIEAGDFVTLSAKRGDLLTLIHDDVSTVATDLTQRPQNQTGRDSRWLQDAQSCAEATIPHHSSLVGKTIKEVNFRNNHHCVVLGIRYKKMQKSVNILDRKLEDGDTFLLQGKKQDIDKLRTHRDIVLLEWTKANLVSMERALVAAGIFLFSMFMVASEILPVVTGTMIGATLMVLFRVITINDAVRALDYKIVFVISASLAMGLSLQKTGGADFIANALFYVLQDWSPLYIMAVLFIIVAVTTNFLSNNATAVLFTPIALALAEAAQAPPIPFAIAVLIAANCSFASPIGYQTNLLVMEPGGYRPIDYLKSGLPLLLICWISFMLFVPLFWDI